MLSCATNSQRTCPTGRAWFDEAYANNAAHATGAECSNMGICSSSHCEGCIRVLPDCVVGLMPVILLT
eukprot:9095-Heterococcus_DN1.PRE.1